MSFKFPGFNLQSIQESIGKVDLDAISKSFQNVNPGKTVSEYSELLKESIQPFTAKTQQIVSAQLQQVQQLAASQAHGDIETSELPEDYLTLEANCDLLLKLYTDLIHYTGETYGTLSYDYPPGNSALTKIKDAHVGLLLSSKFAQLKNVSTPQEMENILLGHAEPKPEDDTVDIQVTSAQLPKTLYGQLAQIATRNGNHARLDQDKKIMQGLNHRLVEVLNEKFIKVNELRKKVYAARLKFDVVRALVGSEDEENEELIAREDDLVSATELAVLEMRKLIHPLENVNLLKVFVSAQKEFFDMALQRLGSLISELDKIEYHEDDE
ncbi:hypothetical protein HF325_000776 [Metschnikowia pulcherrima]|uniref:BAR domain-containing protein n=1 Tax=Metschnikowia pulcherrima TaxID=27326 RepID=A0A8H7GX08_9ASCO|nr:hypothetical protein HF325_000776 [Metschnikowia pulcherrima]